MFTGEKMTEPFLKKLDEELVAALSEPFEELCQHKGPEVDLSWPVATLILIAILLGMGLAGALIYLMVAAAKWPQAC